MAEVMPSDQALRDDIHLLGDLLGETLRAQEGVPLYELVEQARALSKSDFEALARLLATRPQSEALPVARAFAHFLNLANIAEQHHRIRRRREHQREGDAPQAGSFDEVFGRMRANGISGELLFETVGRLRVELVLTAHPTEVVRRTLLQKNRRIASILSRLDHDDLTPPEKNECIEALRREITAGWKTDEVRHQKPSPLDEVKGGLFIFEQTLWNAVPRSLRALDEALREHAGRELPLDAAPIRFGSWIGGDRDGNPNVTAAVTGNACLLSRWVAADLYLREIGELRAELSMARGSRELEQLAGCVREPYRAALKAVRDRLEATRESIEIALDEEGGWKHWHRDAQRAAMIESRELLEPLMVCWRSLNETGGEVIARGRLLDLIRRVHAFGLTLVRLDVRQDSANHTALLDTITRELEIGSYAEWDEQHREEFLLRELTSRRPLVPRGAALGEDFATFEAIAQIHPESLGACVITMAKSASDVLAVALLQKEAGVAHPLRISPLFETRADLSAAGGTIDHLLSLETYRAQIGGRQEVMIGYSDSSKDAGRFAAAWELYQAQEQVVEACSKWGVEPTLFHGRGGSVGRGGGPTYLAIGSQPPGSVDGRLRVTVQGEMIQAEFGLVDIALRTLEVYTTATINATLTPPRPPTQAMRDLATKMAAASAASYRRTVYDAPRFVEYFRVATPEVELGQINIGSRPARRPGGKGGVESLRAIPWQFAWTQNRLLLPSWLGFAEAIDFAVEEGQEALLHEMMRDWPFFRSTIELIEMVLAKAEPRVAEYYDALLVPEDLRPIGGELRTRLAETITRVLRVTGHPQLLETNPVLRRSIQVRNPYVDPINLVQAEILRRYRETGDEGLRDAFVVTVNGIAAGMRNTG